MNEPDIKMAAVTLTSKGAGDYLTNSAMVRAQRHAARALASNHGATFEENGIAETNIVIFGNIILDLAFVFYLNE